MLVKFGTASVVALCLDLLLTLLLRNFAGLSLTVSAAIAFIAVGVTFYFVNEFIVFKAPNSSVSLVRLSQNIGVLTIAFAGRILTISVLEGGRAPNFYIDSAILIIGAGFSFTLNYLANRYFVFRR